MNMAHRYPVLERARRITHTPDLDILEVRKHLGLPLANDMRQWLADQPPLRGLCLDFSGVRAVTLSVAEEVGPLLMQTVAQDPALEQRYPTFHLRSPEPAYTFARAFANHSWAAVGTIEGSVDSMAATTPMATLDDCGAVVILGQLTKQMEQILRFAELRAHSNAALTSEDLIELDFLAEVSPAARSKRLTELYVRRLLGFEENPRNPKERLFTATWRLPAR
ncbi:MAG: hypothetical protein H0W06_06030 [Chloroflexia bacterium]|nr:hypothetical protein [Chloroflexia bacterium]